MKIWEEFAYFNGNYFLENSRNKFPMSRRVYFSWKSSAFGKNVMNATLEWSVEGKKPPTTMPILTGRCHSQFIRWYLCVRPCAAVQPSWGYRWYNLTYPLPPLVLHSAAPIRQLSGHLYICLFVCVCVSNMIVYIWARCLLGAKLYFSFIVWHNSFLSTIWRTTNVLTLVWKSGS